MPSDPQPQALVEQLLTAFRGQLEAALRSHADEAVHRRTDELRRSGETQIAELRAMLDEIRSKAQEHQQALGVHLDEVLRQRDALLSQVHEQDAGLYAQAARLADEVRTLDETPALSGILDAVVEAAGRRADRAAVVTRHETGWRPWRTTGFGEAAADAAELSGAAGGTADGLIGMIAAAATLKRPVSGREGAPLPAFAGTSAPHEAAAFPIPLAGETVAVLYVDLARPDDRRRASWPELEVLARHAGTALEAVTFRQAVGLAQPARVARPSQPSSASAIGGGRVADVAAGRPTGGLQ